MNILIYLHIHAYAYTNLLIHIYIKIYFTSFKYLLVYIFHGKKYPYKYCSNVAFIGEKKLVPFKISRFARDLSRESKHSKLLQRLGASRSSI